MKVIALRGITQRANICTLELGLPAGPRVSAPAPALPRGWSLHAIVAQPMTYQIAGAIWLHIRHRFRGMKNPAVVGRGKSGEPETHGANREAPSPDA
jgi:hypothetical protein